MDEGDIREPEWHVMLTRCYGGISFNAEFKSGLLGKLRAKLPRPEPAGMGTEEDWRRLLAIPGPCRPAPGFKIGLREKLLARRRELSLDPDGVEGRLIGRVLSTSFSPITPRREFASRLLRQLKERQTNSLALRRRFRRRSLFFSLASGLAAAAVVLFVILPVASPDFGPGSAPVGAPVPDSSQLDRMAKTVPVWDGREVASLTDSPPARDGNSSLYASPSPPGAPAAFKVADIFLSSPLPDRARGLGMEFNDGGGWREMDPAQAVPVSFGMAFRPARRDNEALGGVGLGFADGSSISMRGDSLLTAGERGFNLGRGVMSVNVPREAGESLRLNFPEREVAVRPGTFLAVSAEAGEQYAEGGAPAPRITVADGGMAVARGRGGSGILFANHVYDIDNYVSPDLPGRPLCLAECEELEKRLAIMPGAGGAMSNRLAAGQGAYAFGSGGPMLVSDRPSYRNKILPYGFNRQDSRWVADSYDGQPVIGIEYLSDAYFSLADSRRDLAPALALGAEVILDAGDGVFYEIYRRDLP
ncbi:MAG: hypothetical protein LBU64_11115 [Planctomycetota bacterium]|jgi:hypothetical protein|nr:hypothetical protein [Planctomycetota bacterium]